MSSGPLRVFISGVPGSGKTTLIKKVGTFLQKARVPIRGFFTEEIREKGRRIGFRVISWEGNSEILAHIHAQSPLKVGKYKVLLENFEKIAKTSLKPQTSQDFIIIDEIGKMECASPLFREMLLDIVNSNHHLIATIPIKGSAFIETLKNKFIFSLLMLDRQNHASLYASIIKKLSSFIPQNPFPLDAQQERGRDRD